MVPRSRTRRSATGCGPSVRVTLRSAGCGRLGCESQPAAPSKQQEAGDGADALHATPEARALVGSARAPVKRGPCDRLRRVRIRRCFRLLLLARLALAAGALLAPVSARAAWPAPALSRGGMVVASQSDATRAGVEMLLAGGNAVDAAVATAFALCVTQPFSTGIGGGAFILLRLADGEVVAVDARETAPAAAEREMYLRPGVPERASVLGPLAVATPGLVAGLALVQERWGTLPLARVLQPAIRLAEQGFAIGPYHARMLEGLRAIGARGALRRRPRGSSSRRRERAPSPAGGCASPISRARCARSRRRDRPPSTRARSAPPSPRTRRAPAGS